MDTRNIKQLVTMTVSTNNGREKCWQKNSNNVGSTSLLVVMVTYGEGLLHVTATTLPDDVTLKFKRTSLPLARGDFVFC